MAVGRQLTGLFSVLGMLLLVGSVAGTAWWLTRPPVPPDVPPLDPASLDVVCTGRVDAAAGVIGLDPVQAGRVVAVDVAEGEAVRKGQPLIRFDDTAAKARLTQAEAAVAAAQVELDAAEKDAERWPAQLAARDQLLVAAAARVEAGRKLVQQRREQETVTPVSRPELEAMEARVRELVALEAAERGQVDDLRKLDPRLKVRAAQARLAAAQADRELADKAVRECVLAAPADGTVLRLQAAVGGLLGPGWPVPPVAFAPAGPLVVRAEVEQEFLGRVRDGLRATVRDENRPDGKTWTGRVVRVAGWVAQKRSFLLDPGEINDVRTVECVVELDPPADGLWLGQRMRVRIGRGQ